MDLGATYNRLSANLANKRRKKNQKYLQQKARAEMANKKQEYKQTNTRLKNSSNARKAVGATEGFIRGLSFVPINESKHESHGDYRYSQYVPSAYSELSNTINKERAKQKNLLSKYKDYKASSVVGNVGGTIAGAMLTSGLTKGMASKAMGTKAVRKATDKAARLATKYTSEKMAEKHLSSAIARKLLSRASKSAGLLGDAADITRTTHNAVRGLASNVLQDVAYDSTFGAAKDISRYVETGKNPLKNKKEFAKYMLDNAKTNTIYGAIGNAILPAAARLSKTSKYWQNADVYDDIPNAQGKYSHNVIKENVPIRTVRQKEALSDRAYLDYIQKRGIDGKPVAQVAREKGQSILDVITDGYTEERKNISQAVKQAAERKDNSQVLKRYKLLTDNADDTAETTAKSVDNVKASSKATKVKGKHTEQGTNVITNESAEATEQAKKATKKADYKYGTFVPDYDINEKYIRTPEAQTWIKRHTDYADEVEFAAAHHMQPSEALDYARNRIAEKRGYAKLTEEGKKAWIKNAKNSNKSGVNVDLKKLNDFEVDAEYKSQAGKAVNAKGVQNIQKRVANDAKWLHDVSEKDIDDYIFDKNIDYATYAKQNGLNEANIKDIRNHIVDDIRAERAASATNNAASNSKALNGLKVTDDELDQYIKNNNIDLQAYAKQKGLNPADPIGVEDALRKEIGLRKAQGEMSGYKPTTPEFDGSPVQRTYSSAGGQKAPSKSAQSMADYISNFDKKSGKSFKKYMGDLGLDEHDVHSWKDAEKKAVNDIDEFGADNIRKAIVHDIKSGKNLTDTDVMETGLLISKYEDDMGNALAEGNKKLVKELQGKINELGSYASNGLTEHARGLNASKLLSKCTPEGRVRSVDIMVARLRETKGIDTLEINPELKQMLRYATREADINAIQRAIAIDVWDQIPGSLGEKLNVFRYTAMLLNPTTHIRNMLGNKAFTPVRGVRNEIEAGMQNMLRHRIESRGAKRTTVALLTHSAENEKKFWEPAKREFDNMREQFYDNNSKVELGRDRPEGSVSFSNGNLFGRIMNKGAEGNSYLLNWEDERTARPAFEHAFAKYLKAQNIDYANAADDVLDAARKYAYDQALEATYRSESAFANAINKLRKKANISRKEIESLEGIKRTEAKWQKIGGLAADTMLPFTKTPANILRTGLVDFNPVQVGRGLYHMARAKTGQEVLDGIRQFSNGMTGTMLYGLGIMAAHKKIATASINMDDKGYYDRDRGMQDYSFTIGDVKYGAGQLLEILSFGRVPNEQTDSGEQTNVTMDWAMPMALPFFMGVEAYDNIAKHFISDDDDPAEADENIFNAVGDWALSLPRMADPVFNMSLVSSVESAFDTTDAEKNGISHIGQVALNILDSRLGQFSPTIFGKTANVLNPSKLNTKPVNEGLVGWTEGLLRRQANKIPGVGRMFNPEKTDALGNAVKGKTSAKDYALSALENFISPASIRKLRQSGFDKEVQNLASKGAATDNLYPQVGYSKEITKKYGDKTINIDAFDLQEYSKAKGEYIAKHGSDLIKSQEYKDASTTDKAKLISQLYREAKDYGNELIAKKKGISEREYELENGSIWIKIDNYSKEKEDKAYKVGIKRDDFVKIYKNVESYRQSNKKLGINENNKAKYLINALASTEVKGGAQNYEQINASTGAKELEWQKVKALSKKGYTASQCQKFALNDKQFEKFRVYDKNGKANGIDHDKLALYINGMKISQREKWARFEVNRYSGFRNPF